MPHTSYIKATGYWMLLCYISVFYCLIEFCIVIALINMKVSSNNNITHNEEATPELPGERPEVIVYLSVALCTAQSEFIS